MADRARALAEVFRNPDLRRLQLAWGGFYTGEWAHVIALSVYAYEAGGATAVGIVGLVRMLPAAAAVPFASMLVDRYRRERILVVVHALRALALGAAAAVLAADGPAAAVYALAAFAAVASSAFRPAQWALLPLLARTPRELVAANASSATLESVAAFAGPALGGILLVLTGPDAVFAASAAVFAWCAFLVARVSSVEVPITASGRASGGLAGEALAGFRAVAADRHARLLFGLFGGQTIVRGLLNVLIVVCALELLDIGDAGVGFLNSAFGAGGLIGALGALALVGRRRLAGPFGLALILWGAPIALIGIWPEVGVALLALAIVGAGNSILDVAGITLLQRTVSDDVLGRAFGVLETMAIATVGLGAVLAPLLLAAVDTRVALVAVGAFLPLLVAVFWRRLTEVDAASVVHEREVELLRSLPVFAPLPSTTVEALAARVAPVSVAAGERVITQGEPGDRFYVVRSGELGVTVDGAASRPLGPGDSFGEIALLRDVPRTATVAALTDAELIALERDVFVAAVSGHPQSAETAEAVVSTRLAAVRVPTAPL